MTDTMTLGTTTLASDLRLPPQARKVLAHLEAGKNITPAKAQTIYSISRLADCIFKIRRAGHYVITDNRKDEQGHKYAKYRMATRAERRKWIKQMVPACLVKVA